MSYPWKVIFMLWVSGSGKNTMIHKLLQSDLPLTQVISCKTRQLREGEKDGVDYHYMTNEQFNAAIAAGEFLEYEQNYGLDRYATKKHDIIEKLEAWRCIVKELDIKWLIEIKSHHPDVWEVTKSIFLDIDEETMAQRIHKRGVVSEDELQKRLLTAAWERELAKQYCTDIVDASWSIDEEFARVYAVISRYVHTNA